MTSPRAAIARLATARHHDRPLLAVVVRLLAVVMLTVMFTLAKILQGRGVHLIEVVSYRQLLSLPIVVGWIVAIGALPGLRTRRLGGHLARTAVGLGSMTLNIASYALLPLAEATTIAFAAPIFATLLSSLLLREAVGLHRWSAVIAGFTGIVLTAAPASGHLAATGVAIALVGAFGTGMVSILLRQLARTEPATAIVFWFTLLSVPPAVVGLMVFGQAHDLATCLLIGAMGTAGGVAQLLLTAALKFGPVSIVVPMDYSAIIWATVAGWLIAGTLPLVSTWIGAAIIIASGLYIVWREHLRGQRSRPQAETEGLGAG